MTKQLITTGLASIGFLGLNTQESGVGLEPQFALKADNCIIDKFGRLGSRRGWATRTSAVDTVADTNIGINLQGLTNFVDINGVNTFMSWNNTTFFKGVADLTTIVPTTTDTILDGNWQSASLNDIQYFFQRGYKPLYYTNETTPDEFKSIDQHVPFTGTAPTANSVISAYGRLWAADTEQNKTTVYFTDVLDGTAWAGGTAGSLDISSVLTRGTDEITAIGAHNGYLIIFCKRHIVIYGDNDNFNGAITTSTLTLVEVIDGVGCVARDSVQNTGSDIIFLSETGVQSLNRTVQEKSQPMRDISKNIRDDIIDVIRAQASLDNVKSTWSPRNSFYLLTFKDSSITYCFDTRFPLEDGSFRVTEWTGLTHKDYVDYADKLYIAQLDGIAEYFGFQDNGESFRMTYYTTFFDLGSMNTLKIGKRLATTVVGVTGQDIVLKVGYDYSTQYRSFPTFLTGGTISEYAVAEYNIDEYSGGLEIQQVKEPAAGAGAVVQVGVESEINGAPLSIQKLSLYLKQGKVV